MQSEVIDPEGLICALELSRSHHLGDAARRLRIDETTLSRRVSRLERQIGERLFNRARGAWDLTEVGRRLIPLAEGVESNLVAARDVASAASGPLTGTLRVITTDGFGAFVLLPGLAAFRAANPDLYLEVETQTSHALMTGRDFDLAVTLERPKNPGLRVRRLAQYELGLYASHDYLSREGAPESLDALGHHSLIWYIDALLDVKPLRSVDDHLGGVRARVQTNNIAAHVQAAIGGMGIAPLPSYIADREPRLARVLVEEFAVHRSYWLVVPRQYESLSRVAAAARAITDIAARHPSLTLATRSLRGGNEVPRCRP